MEIKNKAKLNWTNISRVLFYDKNLSKAFIVLGTVFYSLSLILYLDFVITIFDYYINNNPVDDNGHRFKEFFPIFIALAYFFGFWSSMWLILGFLPHERIKENYQWLMLVAIFSINPLAAYFLRNFRYREIEVRETINSVILTDIYFYNKKQNILWYKIVRMFSMFSMIIFSNNFIISLFLYKEARFSLVNNSDIRDRISIALMSVFAVLPFVSIPLIVYTLKNPLYISWIVDYDEQYFEELTKLDKKHTINKTLNIFINILLTFTIISTFIMGVFALMTYSFNDFVAYKDRWIYIFWTISIIVSGYSLALKKYYLESNKPVSLFVCLIDIFTINPFFYILGMFYTLKANIKDDNEFNNLNKKMNILMINILILNVVIIIIFIAGLFLLFELNITDNLWKKLVTFGILILSIMWLILNLWKAQDYKRYVIKLSKTRLLDVLFLNFLGLITDMITENFKNDLIKKKKWF